MLRYSATDEISQSNDVNDEASKYLEELIWKQLRFIRYKDPTPPPTTHTDPLLRQFILEMSIVGLEQDKDVVLARLLKAATRVREASTRDEAAITSRFLDQCVGIMTSVGASAGKAFLQTVLEDMIRRDELEDGEGLEDEEQLDVQNAFGDENELGDEIESTIGQSGNDGSLESDLWPTGDGITVSFGNESMFVAFENILSCFWTSWLDTACHACSKPFFNEPPIRTIARVEGREVASALHVRVCNRHFSCIRDRSLFVPVSHVWDDSIRVANKHRVHNNAAAARLVNTLKALFEGSVGAYPTGVEFWHDYFSVPQWQADLKDALLLRLPAIYYSADEILVHMADVPSDYVEFLLIGSGMLGHNDSLLQAIRKIPLLRTVCGSHWMQRMWVALEYAQCRAACVMDKYNQIWRSADYYAQGGLSVEILARDTFSRLIDSAHAQLISQFSYAKTFAISLSLPGEFLGGIAARGHGAAAAAAENRQLCLGEAVELVARKQCEFPRDRLFAVHILLNGKQATWLATDSTYVPQPEVEACAWVWSKALERGDYSPFLLQPCERVVESNSVAQSGIPSWLIGYGGLEGVEWGCGNQLLPPQRPPVVNELAVHADLDLVGQIEGVHYLDVEESGEVAGVDWAIGILGTIARAEGNTLSAEMLVDGLNRVFPFDTMHEKMARIMVNMVLSFEELEEQDEAFRGRIERLLTLYSDTFDDELRGLERQRVAQEISDTLQLEINIAGDLSSEVTRLTRSRHIARHRRNRGARGGEPMCEVRCPGCRRVFLLRLDLRITARIGHSVYRIPGLGYSESVKDGVGLVIDKGRVSGRMLYGPRVCDCQLPESVELV